MSLEREKQLEESYVMPTFARSEVEFVRGEGMHLYDSDGRQYLDFLSGIGVCSLGHCHPVLVNAIKAQSEQLLHVSNYFYIQNRGEVAHKLSDLLNRTFDEEGLPGSQENGQAPLVWKTFFANSGAEANECAIKLARLYARRKGASSVADDSASEEGFQRNLIVTLMRSFHGRTLTTLSATGQPKLHEGFEPMPQGFLSVPRNDVDALRSVFKQHGERICAVMVECIQGESGVNLCSAEFLQEVRRLCDESGACMICDEVQCGIFRTGRPFAFQHFGFVPDIVTTAKGIASGVPAAGCSARAHIADVMAPGLHGSTFGGSNLAMSAALATLSELDQPALAASIAEVGAYLREKLLAVKGVRSVRGLGLMVAADLEDGIDAHDAVKAALEGGIVINATGDGTLRFLPPLICTKSDVDEFVQKLAATLEHCSERG